MSLKNSVTPPGIDPGTVQIVAQRLNHYATPDPIYIYIYRERERAREEEREIKIPTPLQLPWWGRVLLTLIIAQQVKNFQTLYRNQWFVTVFMTAHHRTLSWNRLFYRTLSDIFSLKSTFTLFSHLHLVLRSALFSSGFPTKMVFAITIRSSYSLKRHTSCLTYSYISHKSPSFIPVWSDRITVFHNLLLRFLDTGRKDKRLLHRPSSSSSESSCPRRVATVWTVSHWRWKH